MQIVGFPMRRLIYFQRAAEQAKYFVVLRRIKGSPLGSLGLRLFSFKEQGAKAIIVGPKIRW